MKHMIQRWAYLTGIFMAALAVIEGRQQDYPLAGCCLMVALYEQGKR